MPQIHEKTSFRPTRWECISKFEFFFQIIESRTFIASFTIKFCSSSVVKEKYLLSVTKFTERERPSRAAFTTFL